MLRVAIVDANIRANQAYAGLAASVVSGWLRWEIKRAGVEFSRVSDADIVFLAFSGAIDFGTSCRYYLKKNGIDPDARKRANRPYIVTGGPVDGSPLTALSIADALAVGEGYTFLRELLGMVRDNATLNSIRQWIVSYPHAVERAQLADLEQDTSRPWLFTADPPKLASPDPYVDWEVPPIRSDDNVVRVVASKGCHLKCAFCAVTYRQTYRSDPDGTRVLTRLRGLAAHGERVQMLSNDPANLPYFRDVITRLDSQSFTIMEIADYENRKALIHSGVGIARFGVEGLSERLRTAFGKPIRNNDLVSLLAHLHAGKVNTHMFYIVGIPYESAQDWEEFRSFYAQLARTLRSHVCRIKYTKFNPTPPAPLARFVTGRWYEQHMLYTKNWVRMNAASRHVLHVSPRMGKQHAVDIADLISVPRAAAKQMLDAEITDLAPTVTDANRLPWEIIDWPIDAARRWKIGETYRKRITDPSWAPNANTRVANHVAERGAA